MALFSNPIHKLPKDRTWQEKLQVEEAQRMISNSKSSLSKKKCELASCNQPIGVITVGQEKRFHSKSCRARRHRETTK